MDKVRVIELKQSVFEDNDKKANELRARLKKEKTFLINVMSSPGSGKTTTLVQLINLLKDRFSLAVMEADIDGECDCSTVIEKTGVKAIQLHTGGMCHLDCGMTREALANLSKEHFDCIFLENVGNLVCPAEFDTGACFNFVILSVPEGDDKPIKYPLMFEKVDLVVINKIDVAPYFDFSLERATENIRLRNKNCEIIPISAKTGLGVDKLVAYISEKIDDWRK